MASPVSATFPVDRSQVSVAPRRSVRTSKQNLTLIQEESQEISRKVLGSQRPPVLGRLPTLVEDRPGPDPEVAILATWTSRPYPNNYHNLRWSEVKKLALLRPCVISISHPEVPPWVPRVNSWHPPVPVFSWYSPDSFASHSCCW